MKNLISNIKFESKKFRKKYRRISEKIKKLKEKQAIQGLDSIIVEWFALVQEISEEKLVLKHFDTQLLARCIVTSRKNC